MARARRKKKNSDTSAGRALKGRAEYVIQCIRDQPWLDGRWSRLVTLVRERYPCSETTAGKSVSLAYQMLEDERARTLPHVVGYLDRIHRKVIEMGLRHEDGRVITPAAVALGKLHGVGEENVKVSGTVTHGISQDDRLLLESLRLTNAQRLAEIEKLEQALGVPHYDPTQTALPQPVIDNPQPATEEETETYEDATQEDPDDEA